MAKSTRTPYKSGARRKSSGGGASAARVLLGVFLGVLLTFSGIAAYLRFGRPPVAVTDKPALWEPMLLSVPLKARASADAKPAPFSPGEDAFEGAAHTYRAQCAQCHGTPGHDAPIARVMVPRAQQFFSARDRRATEAQSPGELYWKTAFGIRRSGMPAYNHILSDTQLWQLSLLLHNSATDLPDPVHAILTAGVPPPQPTVVQP